MTQIRGRRRKLDDPAERSRSVKRTLRSFEDLDPVNVDECPVRVRGVIVDPGFVEQDGHASLVEAIEWPVPDSTKKKAVEAGSQTAGRERWKLAPDRVAARQARGGTEVVAEYHAYGAGEGCQQLWPLERGHDDVWRRLFNRRAGC